MKSVTQELAKSAGVQTERQGYEDDGIGAPVKRLANRTRAESSRVHSCYESLDIDATKKTFDELAGVLDALANTSVHTVTEITPHLASMQALLSERGEDRKKVLKLAGLPTWTQWSTAYGAKLHCTLRTIQNHIKTFRQPKDGKGGRKKDRAVRLDGRQQRALVRAQVAANDLVAALKSGADWQTPLTAYEKVAVTPAKLDSYVNELNPGPDPWELLRGFLGMVQEDEDGLSEATVKEMRRLQQLLTGKSKQSRTTTSKEDAGATIGIPIEASNPQTHRNRDNGTPPSKLSHAESPRRTKKTSPSSRSKSMKPAKVTSCPSTNEAQGERTPDRQQPDTANYLPSPDGDHGVDGRI